MVIIDCLRVTMTSCNTLVAGPVGLPTDSVTNAPRRVYLSIYISTCSFIHSICSQLALLVPCILFLMLRGCTGVVAIYPQKQKYWVDDNWFYSLDTLPEFMCLCILCWPCLFARIAQRWPPPTDLTKAKAAAKGQISQQDLKIEQQTPHSNIGSTEVKTGHGVLGIAQEIV